MEDVAGDRAEADLVGHDLAGQRHAQEGAAVEAAAKAMTAGRPVAWRAILTAFSTASAPVVRKTVFFSSCRGDAVDPLGEAHIAFIRHDLVAGVGEAVELRLHRGDHPGWRWPLTTAMPEEKST